MGLSRCGFAPSCGVSLLLATWRSLPVSCLQGGSSMTKLRASALLLLASFLIVVTLVYFTMDRDVISLSDRSPKATPTLEVIQAPLITPNPSPTPGPTSTSMPRSSGSGFSGFSVDRNREGIRIPESGPLFSGKAGKCRIARINAQNQSDEGRRQRGLRDIERYC